MITRSPQRGDIGGWRQQLRTAIRDPKALLQALDLQHTELSRRILARPDFQLRVPAPFVQRMQRGNPNDPLLRQVLPVLDETRRNPGFESDPVGDLSAAAAPGVIHKYHGRMLLITTAACAIHCRYCFRREFPYSEQLASRQGWQAPLRYLQQHEDIDEVILSGGDPLSLGTDKLQALTDELQTLDHVRTLRIHTRFPVVLPQRITQNLLGWLDGLPFNKIVVIHANHANEFDQTVDRGLGQLRDTGVTLLNQAVLLRDINDSAEAQEQLARRGFESGVLPYYLHLLDRAHGTAHFEASRDKALQIMQALRTRLPGYLVARLVREAAGAPYKLPVM